MAAMGLVEEDWKKAITSGDIDKVREILDENPKFSNQEGGASPLS